MSNFRKVISLGAVAILGATNLLTPLSYANAATGYDSLTDADLKRSALSFVMPNHNVTLYAITAANKYFVLYNGNTHTSGTMGSGTFTYDTTGNLAPNAFVKTGYTWSEWNRQSDGNGTHYASGADVFNWTTVENDEINIYAQWNPNTYTIDYDLNKGSATSTPSHGTSHPTTATYDNEFTVSHPSMQGYTFSGWTISNMDTEEHTIGTGTSHATSANGVMATSFENLRATSGIVQFLATWSRNQNTTYKVEHYLEKLEGGYPASPEATDNLTGPTDTEVTPSVKTYEGFTANSANTPKSGNIDPDGNKVFRYEYTRNPYNLTLNAGRGVASVRGSGSVTAPDSTTGTTVITFKYDEPVILSFTLKSGYTGGTWGGYSGTASSFNMPASNIEKTASANPITYTIEYDYNGGSATNSGTYNVETTGFTLNNPTGTNSTFLGWTGGVVGGAQLGSTTPSVTIDQGSTGNRKYYAVWQCLEGYHPSDDRAGNNYGNCVADGNTEYTVQHRFQNLEGTNYVHSGAIDEHKSGETATTTNETGNVYPGFEVDHVDQTVINGAGTGVAKVYYNRLSYTGTIHKDTGVLTATGDGANSPVGGPYKYGDTVTLTATTGAGYVFDGWTVQDASGNNVTVTNHSELTATFVMPASTVTINADAHTQTYNISYEYHLGTATNPATYTVEDNFTLNEPTREKSVFLGWSGTDITSAPERPITINNMIGNRTYEAIWGCVTGYHASGANECVANTYKVIAEDTDGTHGSADAVTFTYDQTGSLPDAPSQSGYDFVGWTITGLSGGVEHYIGDVVVTSDGTYVYSGTSTEFKNLTVENGGTVTVEAIWSARNDTKYIVNHYIKNVGTNSYTLSGTVERSGTTDTAVNFSDVDKEFFGFTYSGGYVNEGGTTRPEGSGVTTGNIAKNGSTVINLYYDRNKRTVTLSGDAHVASLTWTGDRSFEYGATVNVSATAKTGYHFVRWEATPTPGS